MDDINRLIAVARSLSDHEAPQPPTADPGLCSQCGEQPSCMVKVGTSDGWCTSCLDNAAFGERLDDGLAAKVLAALLDVATDSNWSPRFLAGWHRGMADAQEVVRALLDQPHTGTNP